MPEGAPHRRAIVGIKSENDVRDWYYGIDLGEAEAIRRIQEDQETARKAKTWISQEFIPRKQKATP